MWALPTRNKNLTPGKYGWQVACSMSLKSKLFWRPAIITVAGCSFRYVRVYVCVCAPYTALNVVSCPRSSEMAGIEEPEWVYWFIGLRHVCFFPVIGTWNWLDLRDLRLPAVCMMYRLLIAQKISQSDKIAEWNKIKKANSDYVFRMYSVYHTLYKWN